jgi:DNA-binding PadR family transcriptional regulator
MRSHHSFHDRFAGGEGPGGRFFGGGRPGHSGHGGPGGHGGRGGRGGRVFDHGELRLVVLALIAESPRHGYELIKAIEERLAGSYSPSPGVIYPTLTMLEELGHATVQETAGKKLYAITDEGRAWLVANQRAVDTALARMKDISARHGGGPAPQIIRAMENLKLALRMRMGRGPLTPEELQGIAAAIDAAAVAIERT